MRDGSFLESQLVGHIEPMVEEYGQQSLGPTIDEGHTNVQVANMEVVFADIGHQEVLGPDMIVLQVMNEPMETDGAWSFWLDEGGYFGDNGAQIFGSTH